MVGANGSAPKGMMSPAMACSPSGVTYRRSNCWPCGAVARTVTSARLGSSAGRIAPTSNLTLLSYPNHFCRKLSTSCCEGSLPEVAEAAGVVAGFGVSRCAPSRITAATSTTRMATADNLGCMGSSFTVRFSQFAAGGYGKAPSLAERLGGNFQAGSGLLALVLAQLDQPDYATHQRHIDAALAGNLLRPLELL